MKKLSLVSLAYTAILGLTSLAQAGNYREPLEMAFSIKNGRG